MHSLASFIRRVALALALGSGLAAAAPAQALDLGLVAASSDSDSVRKVGLLFGWTPHAPLWQGSRWNLQLRHEVELAGWRVPHARNLLELGYSPVFRLERPLASRPGSAFFAEAAIGLRLLSHTRIAPDRKLSTAFQFSDELRAGWQWGADGRHTLGARFQHLSNAGIKHPNPGINFWQLFYRYRF